MCTEKASHVFLKRSVLGGAHKFARKSAQIANRLCLGVDVHRGQLSLALAVSQARHASIRAGFDSGVLPGRVRPGGRSSASAHGAPPPGSCRRQWPGGRTQQPRHSDLQRSTTGPAQAAPPGSTAKETERRTRTCNGIIVTPRQDHWLGRPTQARRGRAAQPPCSALSFAWVAAFGWPSTRNPCWL